MVFCNLENRKLFRVSVIHTELWLDKQTQYFMVANADVILESKKGCSILNGI